MNTDHVKSESAKMHPGRQDAEMSHVIDALKLGQQTLAEDLFARVSKMQLRAAEMAAVDDATSSYRVPAKVKRVRNADFVVTHPQYVQAVKHSLVGRLDTNLEYRDMDEASGELATQLESALKTLLSWVFWGVPHTQTLTLIDALKTEIHQLPDGRWAFCWTQEFALE